MRTGRYGSWIRLVWVCWMGAQINVQAQTGATFAAPTRLKKATKPVVVRPKSSARTPAQPNVKRPADSAAKEPVFDPAILLQPTLSETVALTFTASTDQRFFFFDDTRNADNRRIPTSVYGGRAGYLVPRLRQREKTLRSGQPLAAFKVGLGFYFKNQRIDQPGLLPDVSVPVTRRLRYAMVFYEPYLFRRGNLQISLPVEMGYGWSRYVRSDNPSGREIVARESFVPVGAGVLTAYQFPVLRWFRPLHWFGINVLTGYRYVLKRDVPGSKVNYNGIYISAGPSFYLENVTADLKNWRQRRRKMIKNKG